MYGREYIEENNQMEDDLFGMEDYFDMNNEDKEIIYKIVPKL